MGKNLNTAPPNPFAVGGLGTQIFGKPASSGSSSNSSSNNSSTESLVVALSSVALQEEKDESGPSVWASAPSFPALYLNTVSEYIIPPKEPSKSESAAATEKLEGPIDGEKYENSLKVDFIFERFVERVKYEGEQCLRQAALILLSFAVPYSSVDTRWEASRCHTHQLLHIPRYSLLKKENGSIQTRSYRTAVDVMAKGCSNVNSCPISSLSYLPSPSPRFPSPKKRRKRRKQKGSKRICIMQVGWSGGLF